MDPDDPGADPGVASPQAASPALRPDACMFRHIMRASREIAAAYDPVLAPAGLTGHQFHLVLTLNQRGPMTVGKLAMALGMDPSGVPRAIRPLTESGYVFVERGEDRRERRLSLTPAGEAALAAAIPHWTRVQTSLLQQFGADRWMGLAEELQTLRSAANIFSGREGDVRLRPAAEVES